MFLYLTCITGNSWCGVNYFTHHPFLIKMTHNTNDMKTMMNLRNMQFYAYHGVMPHEKIVGGEYRVTLQLEADLLPACGSDDLDDTLNYAELYDLVKGEMEIPSRLIEHLAGRIRSKIKEHYPQIASLTVTVAKLHPPISGMMEAAEITLTD